MQFLNDDEDSKEETLRQSDDNLADTALELESKVTAMGEFVSEVQSDGGFGEQILVDLLLAPHSSQTEMDDSVVTSAAIPQDDKGHETHNKSEGSGNAIIEEQMGLEKEADFDDDVPKEGSPASDVADLFVGDLIQFPNDNNNVSLEMEAIDSTICSDGGDIFQFSDDGKVDFPRIAVDIEEHVNREEQFSPVRTLGEFSDSMPIAPPFDIAPSTKENNKTEGKRVITQFMLSDNTRERINEIFGRRSTDDESSADRISRKISPMWENNPWVEYLVFLTASVPKNECILMVEALINFYTIKKISTASFSAEQLPEGAQNSGVGTTDQAIEKLCSVDVLLRLLLDFYNHILTKVPGRIEDECKAREQAAIVTAVYYCILVDYFKILTTESASASSASGIADATAAFFVACMTAKERKLVSSATTITSSSSVEGGTAADKNIDKKFDEICETVSGESSSQSPNSKNNQHLVSEVAVEGSSSSGGSMVNHVGSLLRKKLHLDSKSSKHGDSTDTNQKGRSSLKRFGSKSSNSASKQKAASDSQPKPPQEVAEGEDYTVYIHREMLGLTVENVLERTIIRTVLPHGAAKKSGAKVGSLIVQVGAVKTYPLTHFETIDELRRSNRPLKLDLRMISANALKKARGEMGRLIRGGEFGREGDMKEHIMEESDHNHIERTQSNDDDEQKDGTTIDEHSESYEAVSNNEVCNSIQTKSGIWQLVSYRWNSPIKYSSGAIVADTRLSKKEKAITKAGEKLAALLTLFLMGIDYDLYQNSRIADDSFSNNGETVGKTVAKLLFEYVSKHIQVITEKNRTIERCKVGGGTGFPSIAAVGSPPKQSPQQQPLIHSPPSRHRSKSGKKSAKHPTQNPNTTAAGVPLVKIQGLSLNEMQHSPLWQLGDVLHRARSFLADCTLKSALAIQTQLIALLCDILDVDSEMELSQFDEESHSYASTDPSSPKGSDKQKGGMQGDLGCAGSLLKLIIRNSAEAGARFDDKAEGIAAGGNAFLAVVHRLAASRSPPARITACSLGPVLWSHLDFAHTLQLRGVMTRSLHDVDVNVRRSTAAVLHETAELVFDPRSVPWLVLMCERAMTDPEPQLRAAAMTLTWHLAEHLPNAFLGDARKGSRSRSRLPARTDPMFAEVYLLQCKLLPVATRLAEDRSASVRIAVAAQCDRLCAALGDHWFAVIIDLLQALLGDSDERVRAEAVLCLPRLVENVLTGVAERNSKRGVSVLESLLPHMLKLAKDPSSSVRAALATSSGELLTLLVGLSMVSESDITTGEGMSSGLQTEFKEHLRHVDEMLIPLAQQLLNDKDVEVTSAALRAVSNASRGDVKELRSRLPQRYNIAHVQMNSARDLDVPQSPMRKEHPPVVVPVLSEGQIMRLLPTLTDLSSSSLWRVRQSAVEVVPALLGCTQRLETRTAIAQLCVTLMGDSVDAVRRTAAECLCVGGGSLGGNGGGEWLREIVIPIVKQCRDNELSKQRLLCLKMIEVLIRKQVCACSEASSSRSLTDSPEKSPLRVLLEVAASLSCDKTVNVRLNVGRVLGDVIDECSSQDNIDFIRKTLEGLILSESSREDGGDRDVLYFAKSALEKAQTKLNGGEPANCVTPSTATSSRRPSLAEI